MGTLKLVSKNKDLVENYRTTISLLLPLDVDAKLKDEVQKRLNTRQLELITTAPNKPAIREIEFKTWLTTTKSGKISSFEAHQMVLKTTPREARAWLWKQFYLHNPAHRPQQGRPLGVAPNKVRKEVAGDIVAAALELYFKRLARQERAHAK